MNFDRSDLITVFRTTRHFIQPMNAENTIQQKYLLSTHRTEIKKKKAATIVYCKFQNFFSYAEA